MHICAHSQTHACNYHVVNPVIILAEHKYTHAWTYTHVHTHTRTHTHSDIHGHMHTRAIILSYILQLYQTNMDTHNLHTSCTQTDVLTISQQHGTLPQICHRHQILKHYTVEICGIFFLD